MNDAFDLMLGVYRAPSRAALLHGRALPQQIVEVIRVAAGDAESVADAHDSTGLHAGELAEAAVLLLHHLLFFDGADHYRVLGVTQDADDEQIKRHYRVLMRWLHPDRDPDNLHSVFAERVNRAWNALRTPQRRASYDDGRLVDWDISADTGPSGPHAAAVAGLAVSHWQPDAQPWLSGRMIRRLPQIVAAGSALLAVLLLALVFWLQRTEPHKPTLAIAPLPAAPPAWTPPIPAPAAASTARIEVDRPAVRPAPDTLFASTASALTDAIATPAAAEANPPAPRAEKPIAVQPVVAARTAPTPISTATAATALSEDEVIAFVAHFERLYAGDDVDAFLALFGEDAVGNGSDRLHELSVDYRRLFSTYARRELRLRDMRWQIDAGRAVGHGRYDAKVDAAARDAKPSQGQILLALRRDANGLHITRLNHSVGH